MGDGLHNEPEYKWVEVEYKRCLRALGLAPKRKSNIPAINEAVAKFVSDKKCDCGGNFIQKRSGSFKVLCGSCGAAYVLKRKKENERR